MLEQAQTLVEKSRRALATHDAIFPAIRIKSIWGDTVTALEAALKEIERLEAALAAECERCAGRIEVAADLWIKDDPKAAQRLMNLATQLRIPQ